MMTGRAGQWHQLALAVMLGAGVGGKPSLFSVDVSDEDAK